MSRFAQALKFLVPGWFTVPMGIAGLALAWLRAAPLMGEMAEGVALVLGAVAAAVFVALVAATVWRGRLHPQAWAEDRRHPVRHTFIATLPVATILVATLAVLLFGAHPLARALWWIGSVAQLGVTLWVVARWWRGASAGGLVWASVTPALFIPIVGNVLVPLAGVPLGHETWASAQFGVGVMFWPVVLVLLLMRPLLQGPWPDRLRPSIFILVAPPAVVGSSLLQLGAPLGVAWACWGMAVFSLFWAALQLRQILALPFLLVHWAVAFPLAALTALTLRLGGSGSPLAVLGPLLLALTSLVVLMLAAATLRGLRNGSLLAPEPVAAIAPAAA